MRTFRVLTIAVCLAFVAPVQAAQLESGETLRDKTPGDLDEVRHVLRRGERLLNRIDVSWLERSSTGRLSGRLGRRIEEQRRLLHRLQDEFSRTSEQALGAPGAPRLFEEFYALRRDARDLVEELEGLTRTSRRALEAELMLESELQELRLRIRHGLRRELQKQTDQPSYGTSTRATSAPSGKAATVRRFSRLQQELERIDGIRDPEKRLASLPRLRLLRRDLKELEWSRTPRTREARPRVSPILERASAAGPAAAISGTGSITGTVTEEGSGTELENIHLELFDASGGWVGATSTNAAGVYEFSGLGTGDYYIKTWPDNAPYIDEVWPDVYCPAFCNPLIGSPISVTDGSATSGIDLALALGGLISGRVTDSSDGSGIEMWVEIYEPSGNYVAFGSADSLGYYESALGLPPGDYFVWAKTIGGEHISEVYDNIVCHFWTQCGPADIVAGTAVPVTAGATTSGIDLVLDPAGVLVGVITDQITTDPIADAGVDIWNAAGERIAWSWWSDPAGEYMAEWPLPAGSYYLTTWNHSGHLDELHDGLACVLGDCVPTDGTPVAMTSGAVTQIDFALTPGASFSGTVRDEADGSPIADGLVQVYDSSGDFLGDAWLNPDGTYFFGGMTSGTYYAHTVNWADYLEELYDDLPCWSGCDPLTGTGILVTAGTETTGVDFDLVLGASFSGTVRDEADGSPIEDGLVSVYDTSGDWLGDAWLNPDGTYSFGGITAGTYYAHTVNWADYLDELYDDLPCWSGCDPLTGTGILVTAGTETTGVDFDLVLGASFSGTVRDEADGSSIEDGLVSVYDTSGDWLGDAWLNLDGTYSFGGITAGTYYAHSHNWADYLDELYDDLPCWLGCDPLTGTGIAVTAGTETTGIDFDLVLGGSFSGTVRATADNSPIADGVVPIHDASGNWVREGYLDEFGDYTSYGLPPGTYYARTVNWAGYLDELYDDHPCWDGCDETTGDPILVTGGVDLPGIDFYLETGGSISGGVSASGSGTPISNGSVTLYDEQGWWYDWSWLEPDGTYLFEGLTPGTYYVTTSNSEGYLDELYDDILCASGSCDPTSGTDIVVPAGTAITGIDFILDLGGSIEGTVRDASDDSAISGVQVEVYDQRGWQVTVATTDGAGLYSAGGLVSGSYYAVTNNWKGYINEIHAGVACVLDWPEDCLRGGMSIAVTLGSSTSGIDFDLDLGGSISGTLTEDGSGAPLEDIGVVVLDSTGREVAYNLSYTDAAGAFTVTGLPTGEYYARTDNWGGSHIDELYDNQPAPFGIAQGVVHLGTPISVTAPLDTTGIDFFLLRGGSFSGEITDGSTGLPLEYANARVYDAGGAYRGYAYSDSDGLYESPGLPSGTYFARAYTWGSHAQQLFDGLACEPWCIEEAGSPIAVTLGADTSGIDFALDPLAVGGGSGSISGRVTEAGSGIPLEDIDVDIYDQNGSYVTYGWTGAEGYYTADGLATGNYYARTWTWEGIHLDELYDDIVCWDGCDETTGTPIPVTDGAETPGIDFALLEGGRVSGTVTDSAGAPIVNTYVDLFDAGGNWTAYDGTGISGDYEIRGIPAGTYHAVTDVSPWPHLSFLDELWNDRPCYFGDCDLTTGDDITVTLGNVTSGIDFVLAPGGSIAGRVVAVDSGLPLAGTTMEAYDLGGDYLTRSWSDATGYYSLGGLPTGDYYVRVFNWDGYLNEVYDDIPCPLLTCDVTAGSAIAVTAGSTTAGKDFGLMRGGAILGEVTDAASGLPAAGARVDIYNSSGQQLYMEWIDAAGRFAEVGFPSGTYYAMASGPNHLTEAYDGIPCAGCDITTTTPISVTAGLATHGIDFDLDMGASVVGSVIDAVTGEPVTSGQVDLHDAAGASVTSTWLDASGRYYASGLLPSTMCARTDNYEGLMDKRYDDLSCVGSCDPEKGTPFALSLGTRTSGIDFGLFGPGADPDIVLQAERLDSGVTVSGCDRLTVGPDLGVTTSDPVRLVGREIVVTNGFFTTAGVEVVFDADAFLTCP